MRKATYRCLSIKKAQRGQTALETAFVFSTLLFIAFAMVNFGIKYHTHNIATYAAFMAGRSYQVLGDMRGSAEIEEVTADGSRQEFLKELKDKEIISVQQVAEDIFTCALPWVRVPPGDGDDPGFGEDESDKPTSYRAHCLEGQRKYEKMNIGDEKKLTFAVFGDQSAFGNIEFDKVPGAYAEEGREGIRYGILTLKYRTPILADPLGVFTKGGENPYAFGEVSTPILINPGLETGVSTEAIEEGKNIKEAFKDN